MKNINKLVISLLLCMIVCLGLILPVAAEDKASPQLSLDQTVLYEDELPKTIKMTVSTSATKTLVTFGAKVYSENADITLKSITAADAALMATSTTTGKFAAMIPTGASVKKWAIAEFELPDNLPIGTYTLGVKEMSASDMDSNSAIDAEEKTITFTVNAARTLTSISISKAPSKKAYYIGENFSKTGMTVTAKYDDGSSRAVTTYTISNGSNLQEGQTEVNISYTEKGVTKEAVQKISVTNALASIKVTQQPVKTLYVAGEIFDPKGLEVTAVYYDKHEAVVTSYTISGTKKLSVGKNVFTISYEEGGITKTTVQTVTATATAEKLTGISISVPAYKTEYLVGDSFSTQGLTVKAKYDSGTERTITAFTVPDGDSLKLGQNSVTISYTENGVTMTASQQITVSPIPVDISGVEVNYPTKTEYLAGENFDKTGLSLKIFYSDGTGNTFTDFTVKDGNALKVGTNSVTVTCNANGVNMTFHVPVTVKDPSSLLHNLSGLRIASQPTKAIYEAGEDFDASGMVVMAQYTDGTEAQIVTYTVEGGTKMAAGTTSVTISYSEDGITKTTSIQVAVPQEDSSSFPWWVLVIVGLAVGCVAIVAVASKKKDE